MVNMKWLNEENEPRHVGFEIEYLGLTIEDTSHLLTQAFDGKIETAHQNLCYVHTSLGKFKIEVDVQLLEKLTTISQQNKKQSKIDIEGAFESIIGPLLTTFMPNEIVCPPIKMTEISELDKIINLLRKAGGKGTSVSVAYAFGLHINPEVYSTSTESILSYIQAFCLLYDALNEKMQMDLTRKLTLFAKHYPQAYIELVLNSEYQPDQYTLIKDYAHLVKSRNRALDCLPLFMHLDEKLTKSMCSDSLIKPRPTFHFRMPNCKIDDPSWCIEDEWQHWTKVEALARNKDLRDKMIVTYQECQSSIDKIILRQWLDYSMEILDTL